MLDFNKLMNQIKDIKLGGLVDGVTPEEVMNCAQETFEEVARNPSLFERKLEENKELVLWPVALPLEPFGTQVPVPVSSQPVTVVACDGSQIMPSHHEVHSCYLLNVGCVTISYEGQFPAILESEPLLFANPEDLYPLVDHRRIHVDELFVSLERYMLELKTLFAKSEEASKRKLPVVAFLDGSLMPWSLDKMPPSYQESFTQRVLEILQLFQKNKIAIVAYLSQSRASDTVNLLRMWRCPYAQNNCLKLCGHLNEEEYPCSKIWPLSDRQLFSTKLAAGTRSPVFVSGSRWVRSLPFDQQTCFAYLHHGTEAARLEFPRYVFEDKNLFADTMEVVLMQAKKGMGYPVALAEAHYLAVIQGHDRKHFFDLLSKHMVEQGLSFVGVSPKESSKRRGFV